MTELEAQVRSLIAERNRPMARWQPVKPDHRIEDVRDLLAHGESHAVIADRLGLSCAGLAKWLRSHGERELGRAFEAAGRVA